MFVLTCGLDLSAQQSANTVSYKITYDFSTERYTVWVVPEYSVPNTNNSNGTESGATAQVSLAVPKDFVIANVTDVTGSWEKNPLKLGPGQPNQDWSSVALDAETNYYVIGKSSEETNYGSFTAGVDVPLFTFAGNACFGQIRIINPNEPFIAAADNIFSLNVANSFYSRSGAPQGGNQEPLEQFRAVAGTPAICTVDFIANPDNTTTPPNTLVTIPVLNNDTKNGIPLVPALHTVTIATNPTNGNVTVNPNGTVNYTPNTGFSGTDCFVYRVCEIANPTVCRTADVCVTVPEIRQIFAFDDNNITNRNTPVSGNVVTNDFINNGIPPFVVTTTPVNPPSNGVVTINPNGQYTYIPNNGFAGTDVFEYRVCDSGNPAACDVAAVNIEVRTPRNTNNPPIALADKVATKTNVPVSYNVLTNDVEPDGQPLTATLLTQPVNGTLTFNSNGNFTYTPNNGFKGKDTFMYRACDNALPPLCDEAMVEIEVYDGDILDQPPVANDDIFIRQENQNVTGNVLINDIDPNGLTLTATTTPLVPPTKGTVTLNSNGSFVYTPGVNYDGFDTFVYQVCNNAQVVRCSQATVFILESLTGQQDTDISVTKTALNNAPQLNDEVTFIVAVTNNGNINATNVVVRDNLPTGLQYISGANSVVNGMYYWQIAVLAPGETRNLSIRARVIDRGVATNTATIESLDQNDTDPTNDVAQACISVPITLCQGEIIELSAPAGVSNVQWFKDGVLFATGNNVNVSQSGSYTTKNPNDSCPTNNCCPIIVTTEVCCQAEICIPITIKKVR